MQYQKLLILAAGLILAGCAPIPSQSVSSSTDESDASSLSSSSSSESSSASSSASQSSQSSSESPALADEETRASLENNDTFKKVLDELIATPISGLSFSYTGNNPILEDPKIDESYSYRFASEEVLTTKDGSLDDYTAVLGSTYYSVETTQSSRSKIDDDVQGYVEGYMTSEDAEAYLSASRSSAGFNRIFSSYSGNAGDPWYGKNHKKATSITLSSDFTAGKDGYIVSVDAYYENDDHTASYGSNYSYSAEFTFDDQLALVSLFSQEKYAAPADWDYEKHAPSADLKSQEIGTNVIDIEDGDIDYAATPATDSDRPILSNLASYYVSGVEGTATLSGQSGEENGKPVFLTGDAPTLSSSTVLLPATALNKDEISITKVVDSATGEEVEDALVEDEYGWEPASFAKAGTYDLYFGDTVDPEIFAVENVVVKDREPVAPIFSKNGTFYHSSANGHSVDYSGTGSEVSIPLSDKSDTVYLTFAYGEEGPFLSSAVNLTSSNPEVATAEKGNIGYLSSIYDNGIEIKLSLLSVGTTTITATTTADASQNEYGTSTASIKITVTEPEEGGEQGNAWSDAISQSWTTTPVGGSGIALPPEPSFDYTAAEVYDGSGILNIEVYLYIQTADADSVSKYAADLVASSGNGTSYEIVGDGTGASLSLNDYQFSVSLEYSLGDQVLSVCFAA